MEIIYIKAQQLIIDRQTNHFVLPGIDRKDIIILLLVIDKQMSYRICYWIVAIQTITRSKPDLTQRILQQTGSFYSPDGMPFFRRAEKTPKGFSIEAIDSFERSDPDKS